MGIQPTDSSLFDAALEIANEQRNLLEQLLEAIQNDDRERVWKIAHQLCGVTIDTTIDTARRTARHTARHANVWFGVAGVHFLDLLAECSGFDLLPWISWTS